MSVGIGYDLHRLVAGRRLILGGVEIPFDKGLLGHSDADALIHAIIDALLGAAGMGVIGQYFPDNDPQWKDANSINLLSIIGDKVMAKGFKIVNIDSTIIAEKPKLQSFFPLMKQQLALALKCSEAQINIKATTNEGMDAIGRGEALVAMAVAELYSSI